MSAVRRQSKESSKAEQSRALNTSEMGWVALCFLTRLRRIHECLDIWHLHLSMKIFLPPIFLSLHRGPPKSSSLINGFSKFQRSSRIHTTWKRWQAAAHSLPREPGKCLQIRVGTESAHLFVRTESAQRKVDQLSSQRGMWIPWERL